MYHYTLCIFHKIFFLPWHRCFFLILYVWKPRFEPILMWLAAFHLLWKWMLPDWCQDWAVLPAGRSWCLCGAHLCLKRSCFTISKDFGISYVTRCAFFFFFLLSVLTRNEKFGSTSRAYPETRGQWGSSICLFSSPALEENRRGSKSAALYMGGQ